MIDDVRIYNRVLTPGELPDVIRGKGPNTELADDPSPENEATDVPRDTILAWTAGEFAATHDVYFGTVFDDVNDASRDDPKGVWSARTRRTPPSIRKACSNTARPTTGESTRSTPPPTTRSSKARPGASPPSRLPIRSPAR